MSLQLLWGPPSMQRFVFASWIFVLLALMYHCWSTLLVRVWLYDQLAFSRYSTCDCMYVHHEGSSILHGCFRHDYKFGVLGGGDVHGTIAFGHGLGQARRSEREREYRGGSKHLFNLLRVPKFFLLLYHSTQGRSGDIKDRYNSNSR